MKIKIFSKAANDDELKPMGKINNPNIPVTSDFDDIIKSLDDSKKETAEPIRTAIKLPYIPKGLQKEEAVTPEEASLKEKANEYLKEIEAKEKKQAKIEKEEALLEHREVVKVKVKHLEDELKAIDPDYAEVAAKNEKEVFKAVKQKKKNSIPWRNYLVYLVILTALTGCFTFAKYVSAVNGDSATSVAKFDVSIVTNDMLLVNGDTASIVFDGYLQTDYLAGQNADRVYRFNVENASDISITFQSSVSGNDHHQVTVTPATKVLLPGESTVVMVKISPSDSANSDSIVVTFSSVQND